MPDLDLNAIKAHHERTLADDDQLTISEHERGLLLAEVERLRAHVLDIAAHATPYGDIPDDPGYVGTYLLTAGALHRALGTIGHTAPSCQAEAERDEQARDRHRWRTRAEKAEAVRDALKAETRRIADRLVSMPLNGDRFTLTAIRQVADALRVLAALDTPTEET